MSMVNELLLRLLLSFFSVKNTPSDGRPCSMLLSQYVNFNSIFFSEDIEFVANTYHV